LPGSRFPRHLQWRYSLRGARPPASGFGRHRYSWPEPRRPGLATSAGGGSRADATVMRFRACLPTLSGWRLWRLCGLAHAYRLVLGRL